MTMPPSNSALGIGIVTKNRWSDLFKTLDELKHWGLDTCQIVVIDDGSDQPCPPDKQALYPFVTWTRSDTSLGLLAQRNRLARMLTADYYLSLDDDSYPVAGDLSDAVSYLRAHADIHSLALNMSGKRGGAPQVDVNRAPFETRQFVGCGVIHDRRKFLEIGGFREELKFYCEEEDYCGRMLEMGQRVFAFPGVVICHDRSLVDRDWSRRCFHWARSKALIVIWLFPIPVIPLRLILAVVGRLREGGATHWVSTIRGFFRGVVDGFSALNKRTPMSLKTYRDWRNFPWSPSC